MVVVKSINTEFTQSYLITLIGYGRLSIVMVNVNILNTYYQGRIYENEEQKNKFKLVRITKEIPCHCLNKNDKRQTRDIYTNKQKNASQFYKIKRNNETQRYYGIIRINIRSDIKHPQTEQPAVHQTTTNCYYISYLCK